MPDNLTRRQLLGALLLGEVGCFIQGAIAAGSDDFAAIPGGAAARAGVGAALGTTPPRSCPFLSGARRRRADCRRPAPCSQRSPTTISAMR